MRYAFLKRIVIFPLSRIGRLVLLSWSKRRPQVGDVIELLRVHYLEGSWFLWRPTRSGILIVRERRVASKQTVPHLCLNSCQFICQCFAEGHKICPCFTSSLVHEAENPAELPWLVNALSISESSPTQALSFFSLCAVLHLV